MHKLLCTGISAVFLIVGCDPGDNPVIEKTSFITCEGCHTNEASLKTFTEDQIAGDENYAGSAEPMDPWEKVFIPLTDNQKSYRDVDPAHGLIGCINCHGGREPGSFDVAHDTAYGFVRDPSIMPEQNCNPCHEEIVEENANSMHTKAWGMRTAIVQRELGADKNHLDFDSSPVELTDGFDKDCSSCHATCGQCHISRPNTINGGLVNGHRFTKTPDQDENCLACHGSRIATDYKGTIEGNEPSAHFTQFMKCLDCHTANMHADASQYESRYHLPGLPKCTNCHEDSGTSNLYHSMHWPETEAGLACQVCHSQPYTNCNNCHTNGEWKTGANDYTEYPEFRIGLNVDEELHSGKWVVVRHIPVSPDSYEPWGHAQLAHYDDRPTWEYTSPHNIVKKTRQTSVGTLDACYLKCHVSGSVADANQDLFLWQSFVDSVYPEESEANQSVAIDSLDLPEDWKGY